MKESDTQKSAIAIMKKRKYEKQTRFHPVIDVIKIKLRDGNMAEVSAICPTQKKLRVLLEQEQKIIIGENQLHSISSNLAKKLLTEYCDPKTGDLPKTMIEMRETAVVKLLDGTTGKITALYLNRRFQIKKVRTISRIIKLGEIDDSSLGTVQKLIGDFITVR